MTPHHDKARHFINASITAQWVMAIAGICFLMFAALVEADEHYKRQDLAMQEASVKW